MVTQKSSKTRAQAYVYVLIAAVSLVAAGCQSENTGQTVSANSAATSSTSNLTISPSAITLSEGEGYTFSASGGSGAGYSFSLVSGGSAAGMISYDASTSAYFEAANDWTGTTYMELTDSAGNSTYATITITSGSTSTTGALAISPSSVTIPDGEQYYFSASGGSGAGYNYSVSSGLGTINSSTGLFQAPNAGAGTTTIEVTDSAGDTAYATVTTTASSGSTTTTMSSVTGTLTDCVGEIGGSEDVNNWQVNGTELRTINDRNNSLESPVYCTGLSVAGSIPSTATIQGVSVSIFLINQSSSTDGSLLQSMALLYANALAGNLNTLNLSIPGNSATFPTFTIGSDSDTWGATLTPAVVNSSSFGVGIQAYRGNDRLFLGEASTILPQVTIYYSE